MAGPADAAEEASTGGWEDVAPYHADRLDVYLARQGAVGGWTYVAILVTLLACMAALPLVKVPIAVVGRGVLRSRLDTQYLVAPVAGRVVYVAPPGPRRVAAGDTVLVLERNDLAERSRALDASAVTLEEEARDLEEIIAWSADAAPSARPASQRYRSELIALQAELSAMAERLRAARREEARSAALLQRELTSDAEAAALRDRVLELRRDSLLLRTRTAARWREEAAALRQSLRDVNAEQASVKEQLDQLVVKVPVDGWLDDLSALSAGSRLPPGEPVASVTPASPLIAELYVDPRDVDGIALGGRVRLLPQSRQFTGEGAVSGVVIEVAPALVAAGDRAVAVVRVALGAGPAEPASAGPRLRRGSAVVGRIEVGRRTLWALLRGRRESINRPPTIPEAAATQGS